MDQEIKKRVGSIMQNLFPRHLFGAPFLYDLRDIGIEIRKRVMAKRIYLSLEAFYPVQSRKPRSSDWG
jgi:hypothetical protein